MGGAAEGVLAEEGADGRVLESGGGMRRATKEQGGSGKGGGGWVNSEAVGGHSRRLGLWANKCL
jgi:hypothetical protein